MAQRGEELPAVTPSMLPVVSPAPSVAVLLVNVGTPDSPSVGDVRRYLRQFLSDPRVIDMSAPLRWLLVNLVIAPFRAPKSAAAYAHIWTPEGSPLRVHGEALAAALGASLGVPVRLGMAYGHPSLDEALDGLGVGGAPGGPERLVVVPLFPQYASATTGSVLEAVYRTLATRQAVPALQVLPPFWFEPAFLDLWADAAMAAVAATAAQAVLLSFHGLPERQIRAMYPDCLTESCCSGPPRSYCYRAQCLATAARLRERLGVPVELAFQSRLGRDPWLGPATASRLAALPSEGVTRLVVLAPSFVADCLETVEELGHEGRATFLAAGGELFALVPSPNSAPPWVAALAAMVRPLLGPC